MNQAKTIQASAIIGLIDDEQIGMQMTEVAEMVATIRDRTSESFSRDRVLQTEDPTDALSSCYGELEYHGKFGLALS